MDNGYDSVQFIGRVGEKGIPFTGKFLDAYYGFIKLSLMDDGFIRMDDLIEEYGDRNLFFSVPKDEKQFNMAKILDFVAHGKQPPKDLIYEEDCFATEDEVQTECDFRNNKNLK